MAAQGYGGVAIFNVGLWLEEGDARTGRMIVYDEDRDTVCDLFRRESCPRC